MWGVDTVLKVVTYLRGGETTEKIVNAGDQMEAIERMARSGQKTEKVVAKLNKTSLTYKICSKAMTMVEENLEI